MNCVLEVFFFFFKKKKGNQEKQLENHFLFQYHFHFHYQEQQKLVFLVVANPKVLIAPQPFRKKFEFRKKKKICFKGKEKINKKNFFFIQEMT